MADPIEVAGDIPSRKPESMLQIQRGFSDHIVMCSEECLEFCAETSVVGIEHAPVPSRLRIVSALARPFAL